MLLSNEKPFLKNLPVKPGVYQMLNAQGEVIYVGKAKNLKKRVASYFRKTGLAGKTQALMRQVVNIEVTVTANENEALLLENNLIKRLKPRYNIFFKDDKSFPYLVLSKQQFPRLFVYRGAKEQAGDYFGPYPSAQAVHETLHLAQKVFLVRSCGDNFFRHRTRPCLQYQIKRCSAPCVGYINAQDYQKQVRLLAQLLRGKNNLVIKEIKQKMQSAAQNKQYEKAAIYRDQLQYLETLQTPQRVIKKQGDLDVIALAEKNGFIGLQILQVRQGAVVGSRVYFPKVPEFTTPAEILSAFLEHNYLSLNQPDDFPPKILLNANASDRLWLQATFNAQIAKKVRLIDEAKTSPDRAWLKFAETNISEALARQVALHAEFWERFKALQEALALKNLPRRIACFDVSHTGGEATLAACVVFGISGPEKNAYRIFNISGIIAGDDYAALKQALTRYKEYLQKSPEKAPDVLLIDGGKGQLKIAQEVFGALPVEQPVLLAIAKDPLGKKDADVIYKIEKLRSVMLTCPLLALHFLQQVRDETHRFAIKNQRKRLTKTRKISVLEGISGIGAKKRSALLKHFAGLDEIKNANFEDLAKVSGINLSLAKRIQQYLQEKS